jgi:hypothetical protein
MNNNMDAAVLPFGFVVGVAIISILINTIGYKGVLILFGVIAIIVVGFWITVAVSFKNTANSVINRTPAPPPGLPPGGAQQLNGGKKHGKKRK